MNNIHIIRIDYTDNTSLTIESYEIEKIEKLNEAMDLLLRAKNVYEQLKPMMEKK